MSGADTTTTDVGTADAEIDFGDADTTVADTAVGDGCVAEAKTAADGDDTAPDESDGPRARRFSWSSLIVFGVLPLLVAILAAGAGYLKYREGTIRAADTARAQSMQAATEATVTMLSYNTDNVEATLHGAQDRLTGPFRDSYRSLVDDVVIPGAKQKKIAATATVPAAASIAATDNHAIVMVFVNQSIVVGADAPTDTASAVEVTLDKIDQRWLVSGFEPK